jgi:acyl carrier protein
MMRDELIALIESWDVPLEGEVNGETALIGSGLFDSLALFHLVFWIEQQIGAPIDPTALDIAKEWDTVNDVLRFIERRRGQGPRR